MTGSCHFGMRCKFSHPLCLPNGISILDGLLGHVTKSPKDLQVNGKHPSTSNGSPCKGCTKLTQQCALLERECDDLRAELQMVLAKVEELQTCLKRERSTAAMWVQRFADRQSAMERLLQENRALKVMMTDQQPPSPQLSQESY
eukprot:EG_transcript_15558